MSEELNQKILDLAVKGGALLQGEFIISSGLTTTYYFDGRMVSLHPEGAFLIAKSLLPVLKEADVRFIGGPTLGADPIVSSVVLLGQMEGYPVKGFLVRDHTKDHGTGKVIEGPLEQGSRVAIVDDACSTGSSLFRAVDAAESAGCLVIQVMCILDRHQGGSDEARRRGYDFHCLLEANEAGEVTTATA